MTDNDPSMSKAISTVWDSTMHRLCIFHLENNIRARHPTNSEMFMFKHLAYECISKDEFNIKWKEFMDSIENQTLKEYMEVYIEPIKHKWCVAWVPDLFTASVMSSQACESVNAVIKKGLKRKLNLMKLMNYLNQKFVDIRNNAIKSGNITPILMSKMKYEEHASRILSHAPFKLFQESIKKVVECFHKHVGGVEWEVTHFKKIFKLIIETENDEISNVECSCKNLEINGIFCPHILSCCTSFPDKTFKVNLFCPRWRKVSIITDDDEIKWSGLISKEFRDPSISQSNFKQTGEMNSFQKASEVSTTVLQSLISAPLIEQKKIVKMVSLATGKTHIANIYDSEKEKCEVTIVNTEMNTNKNKRKKSIGEKIPKTIKKIKKN